MTTVSIEEIQRNPAAYLHRAQAGESFVVLEAGRQIAEINPILSPSPSNPPQNRRPFGLCAGEFVVPADFDAPLPDDILRGFEGE